MVRLIAFRRDVLRISSTGVESPPGASQGRVTFTGGIRSMWLRMRVPNAADTGTQRSLSFFGRPKTRRFLTLINLVRTLAVDAGEGLAEVVG